MRRLAAVLCLAAVAAACGDDTSGTTTGPTTTVPSTAGAITVEAAGNSWDLPASACLELEGDVAITAAVAEAAAEEVQDLVAERSTGWPTTTAPRPGSEEEFERLSRRAGVMALALGGIAGTDGAIVVGWQEWEQGWARPDEGVVAVSAISRRLDAWRADAAGVTAAVEAACG
jgi:hypothetical protein